MRAWWLALVLAACSPALHDGAIGCADATEVCPDGFECSGGLCWRPDGSTTEPDGGELPDDAGETECRPDLTVQAGACFHPCQEPANGTCPAGTTCVFGAGCSKTPCTTSRCLGEAICGEGDTCYEPCDTECDAFGSRCNGAYCVPDLPGCWPLLAPTG